MSLGTFFRWHLFLFVSLGFFGEAQISTDGSLGPEKTLSGPNFDIGNDLGMRKGGNLFHSFREFNIRPNETATFTGPADIQNVFSRVTGGNQSVIDGELVSSIESADVYFLNPAGVMFGQNATVNVEGSFYVSTGDYLRFTDGTQFHSHPMVSEELTVAAPAAFGFLGDLSHTITFNGSKILVNEGDIVSAMGTEIRFENENRWETLEGQINIAAVHGEGELNLAAADSALSDDLRNGDVVFEENSSLDLGSAQPGTLQVLGNLRVNGGIISAHNLGNGKGSVVDIKGGLLEVTDGGQIDVSSQGHGDAGKINIEVDQVSLKGENESGHRTGLVARGHEALTTISKGGSITISADDIFLENGAFVSVSTFGPGEAGHISAKAISSLTMSGASELSGEGTVFAADSELGGGAGRIDITSGNVVMNDGARFQALTSEAGVGGTITVTVEDSIIIKGMSAAERRSGFSTAVSDRAGGGIISVLGKDIIVDDMAVIETITHGIGDAAEIRINAESLDITAGGGIASQTFGPGKAGDMTIDIEGDLRIEGFSPFQASEISSNSALNDGQAGDAGKVTVSSGNLILENGGAISSTSFGSGAGGNISLAIEKSIIMSGLAEFNDGPSRASGIFANAQGASADAGNAGEIEIVANDVMMTNGSIVSSSTFDGGGRGGNVAFFVGNGIQVNKDAKIISDSEGFGDAGEIRIETMNLSVAEGGIIASDSFGQMSQAGNAGNISINAQNLHLQNGGVVSSTTFGPGIGGGIEINLEEALVIDNAILGSDARGFDFASGDAGSIFIAAHSLSLRHAGVIASATFGPGAGGNVTITLAETLKIDTEGSILSDARVFDFASGDAGEINIKTGSAILDNEGEISSSTFGFGKGGTIFLDVEESLSLRNRAGIFSFSVSEGDAGLIEIESQSLSITNGATISSNAESFGDGGSIMITSNWVEVIGSDEQGLTSSIQSFSAREDPNSGDGGEIVLQIGELILADGAEINTSSAGGGKSGRIHISGDLIDIANQARIASESRGSNLAGDTGSITINATNDIGIFGNAAITTEALSSGGGSISLAANQLIYLLDSRVSTTVHEGTGSGGDIDIDPIFVVLNDSDITANAEGGNGGNITIITENFIESTDSTVRASSRLRKDGRIRIIAPDIDMVSRFVPLTTEFLDVSNLIHQRCSQRSAEDASTLILLGKGGRPLSPTDLQRGIHFE